MKRLCEADTRQEETGNEHLQLTPALPPELWNVILCHLDPLTHLNIYTVSLRQRTLGRVMMLDRAIYACINDAHKKILASLRERHAEQVAVTALNIKYKKSQWFICHCCNSLIVESYPGYIEIEIHDGEDVKVCHACAKICDYCDMDYCDASIEQHKNCREISRESSEEEYEGE